MGFEPLLDLLLPLTEDFDYDPGLAAEGLDDFSLLCL